MNNGKVRIYELSRELNLDNKDILAVCDQLNIAAKSHSSTISEADAERIRASAEKLAGSHASAVAIKPNSPSHGAGTMSQESKGRPAVKKPQILEVRHREPSSSQESDDTTLKAAPAPVRPASVQPSSSRPTPPVRPARPVSPRDEAASTETPESVAPAVSARSGASDAPVSPPVSRPAVRQVRPELIGPPSRPSSQQADDEEENVRPSQVERPILKRDRTDQDTEAREARTTEPRRREGGRPPERSDRPAGVPELRRPTKPVRPTRSTNETDDEGEEIAVASVDDQDPLELKRPTPPRLKRVAGKKQREDDESEEFADKPTKAAPKSKRRHQEFLEDDEEDIDSDLEDGQGDGAAQVALSLMRPAKPKAEGTSKPTGTHQRARKPPTRNTGESSQRGSRREQRQETKRERPTKITLSNELTVQELADELVVAETEVVKILFMKGIMATVTQTLDIPTARIVAEELGVELEAAEQAAEARKVTEMIDANDLESLTRRPPVVTIMGHVDHGKTTLLDSIRKTKVAAGEAGGITQHIGAYHVDVEHDGRVEQVVFLDTPGHEAFTSMRARGARVTDIAILVVAADDGVRPQTIEAISHAKAAEVPIVVAVNKIDKESAQPDRVKQELMEYGLVPEEWGGDTIVVPVSALNGENLDTLLEMILLVAEVEDLQANSDRAARGTVIEANLDKARGPVATLLVQNGTLRVGDILVVGSVFGKVRAMVNDRGKRVDIASPSFAVEVLGLGEVPAAGDEFEVYRDEKEARQIASNRAAQQRQSRLQQTMASRRVSLNSFSAQAQEGELKELNLILKADVQGSVEAILGALQQLPQKEVQVRVLLAAPGEVTETDVDLAAASSAVIIGFNTTLASGSRAAADHAGVDVREYDIIYNLLDDVQAAMEGMLEPEMVEEPLGQVEVRAVFPVGRGAVAGCYVQSGKAIRNCKVRVQRRGQVVFEGNLDSLKRMKEDVKEVNSGFECGIGIDKFSAWEMGDIIETFRMVSKRRTLSMA